MVLLGTVLHDERAKISSSFLYSLPEECVSWFLKWKEGRGRWWVGPQGWLRWSAHPFSGAMCTYHASHPAFAPSTSEVKVGFLYLIVAFLYHIVHNHSSCACMQLFQSLSLYCAAPRRCLSRYKHCRERVPGPSLSQQPRDSLACGIIDPASAFSMAFSLYLHTIFYL